MSIIRYIIRSDKHTNTFNLTNYCMQRIRLIYSCSPVCSASSADNKQEIRGIKADWLLYASSASNEFDLTTT